jgi:hypothetical protein
LKPVLRFLEQYPKYDEADFQRTMGHGGFIGLAVLTRDIPSIQPNESSLSSLA